MSSANSVNFSTRPNKAVERALFFDATVACFEFARVTKPLYVGLGSVWFTDFQLAFKRLRPYRMLSAERDDVVFRRAEFNIPNSLVQVRHLESAALLEEVRSTPDIATRPWAAWIDFDEGLDEDKLLELTDWVTLCPVNSVVGVTFSSLPVKYGPPAERQARLEQLFGDSSPEEISRRIVKDDEAWSLTLGDVCLDYLLNKCYSSGRPGRPVPIIHIAYRDGSPMVTVGVFVASDELYNRVYEEVTSDSWRGTPKQMIQVPPLTMKELSSLQSIMPRDRLTRADVQAAGFDLRDEQVSSFAEYFEEYPAYVQVSG